MPQFRAPASRSCQRPWRSAALLLLVAGIGLTNAPAANAASTNIVAFGASIVAGYGVGMQFAFPAQLETMLRAKGHDVSVTNAGIPGDTSEGMLRRLDSAVPPDTRLVLLGLYLFNDPRRGISMERHDANRREILARLQQRGIKVIEVSAAGVPLLSDNVHPTAEGQALIAKRLMPQVEAAIGRARSR